jgi:hypothetical protein
MDEWNISFNDFGKMGKMMAILPRHADLEDTALNVLEKQQRKKRS